MVKIYYIFSCVFMLSVVHGFSINECRKGGLVPDEVTIATCERDAILCPVKFNGIFNITMKFRAPHYLEVMKPSLIGRTVLTTTQFTGKSSNEDVCNGILNTVCPLVEKESIEYSYSVNFLVWPLVPITMEFSIQDLLQDETTVCFSFDVLPVI